MSFFFFVIYIDCLLTIMLNKDVVVTITVVLIIYRCNEFLTRGYGIINSEYNNPVYYLETEDVMKKIINLLIGDHQDYRVIFIILFPSAMLALYILYTYGSTLNSIVTAVLALDIFAGLISNLQPKTHLAWSQLPASSRTGFVIVHLTLYPLFVILFQTSLPLMALLLSMLITKTLAFAIGNKMI